VAKGEGLDTRAGPLAGTARLAYSPDGKRLACALDGGTVRIWDVAREKVERSFSAQHPRGVPVIASWAEFSPDGKLLAVATTDGHPGPSHLRLWDPETGELRKTVVDGTTQSIWGAVFSSDGKLLAVGDAGGTVGLFETRRWERVGRLESGDQLRSLAWGADSRTLALGLRRDVQVWDAVKGERRKTLRGHTNWVLSMAVSPDGKTLGSGSSDKTVRLWPLVDE
jgi:WD40 repeat protein